MDLVSPFTSVFQRGYLCIFPISGVYPMPSHALYDQITYRLCLARDTATLKIFGVPAAQLRVPCCAAFGAPRTSMTLSASRPCTAGVVPIRSLTHVRMSMVQETPRF